MRLQNASSRPRLIKIKWPQLGITVTAQLNNQNPQLVDLLFECLPYQSLQNHALVSGDHLYHLVPSERLIYTPADYVVPDRTIEPDGTVFLSGLQHLAIKYGPLSEYLPAAPCGTIVPQDLGAVRRVGKLVWEACSGSKQLVEVVVWDACEPEPKQRIPLVPERPGCTSEARQFVQAIHAETEKSWSGISLDIDDIHSGRSPALAGSKNSYFATMVFANGEVRPLGYNVLNNILKIAATQPCFHLQHLVCLYQVFVSTPSAFIGYLGAKFLEKAYLRSVDLMTTLILPNAHCEEARHDFLAIVGALARYVNLLNAQNLQMFPWRHAVEYEYPLN